MSHLEVVVATESDVLQLQKLRVVLAGGSASLVSSDGGSTQQIPASIYGAFKSLVDELSEGKSVYVVHEDEELTTQDAADFLNVSRPYFIKLIESGAIPYTKTGTHRRILLRDVHAYKKVRDTERRAILDQLAQGAWDDGSYFGVPTEDAREE